MNDVNLAAEARAASPAPRRRARPGLAALVAAALLVPAAIFAAGAWAAWRTAWSEADRELGAAAEAAAEFSQRIIDDQARLAARITEALDGASDEAIRGTDAQVQERLSRLASEVPLVRDVVVLGASGQVLVRATAGPAALPEGFGAPFLAALDAPGAPALVVGPARRDPAERASAFSVAHRREGAAGAIVILVDAGATGARLGRMMAVPDALAALLLADGGVVTRHPAGGETTPRLPGSHLLVAALADGRGGGILAGDSPRTGAALRIAFRRIDGRPDLAAVVARPEASIVAYWRDSLAPLMLIAVPATLALWIFAWLVRRQQRALEATLAGLEQRVAERTAALRADEERLRLAIDAGRFGTWEADLATGLINRSERSLDILGLPRESPPLTYADWEARIHPSDRARVRAAWEDLTQGRQSRSRIEYRYQRPDAAWRWLEGSVAVVRADPDTGAPLSLAGTTRDISDRREAEERRDLLTKEVNHRARNTLAIVQAILRLTRADDAAAYARLIEGRIAALARAQSLLAAERWTGAPLGSLLTEELAPFGGGEEAHGSAGARFILDGPPLRLRAEVVQPLGMVVHELATNAAKHGALSTPAGRVAVAWEADDHAGMLRIRWVETGGPAPAFPQVRGVGSRVIEATVAGQLGGSVERRWPQAGLVCDIALPLARMRAGPG